MEQFFELLGKFVIAVGGAGAIIIAISGYISKLFADWFLQKEKAKYQKEIEEYKQQIQKEVEIARNLNEEIAYKKRVIFDSEYKYYEEIAPKLFDAGISVKEYLAIQNRFRNDSVNKELGDELINEHYDKAHKSIFEFHDSVSKYSLFIDKESYEQLFMFFNSCLKKLQTVEPCNDSSKRWVNWEILLEEIIKDQNQVIDFLRNKIRR